LLFRAAAVMSLPTVAVPNTGPAETLSRAVGVTVVPTGFVATVRLLKATLTDPFAVMPIGDDVPLRVVPSGLMVTFWPLPLVKLQALGTSPWKVVLVAESAALTALGADRVIASKGRKAARGGKRLNNKFTLDH